MRVYTIKYNKDVDVEVPEKIGNTFTRGHFVRKQDEYEPSLFRTKKEAKKELENIAQEKGFDVSSCKVVSMYIEEADALFYLCNIAFAVFPEFRNCAKETPQNLL